MRNKCSQQRARFRTVVIESTVLAKSCSQLLCKRVTVNTSSAVVPCELESSSSITKFLDSEVNKPRLSSSFLLSQIESDPKRTLSLSISLWICCYDTEILLLWRNRRSSLPISRRCCCYYWRWISMNKQLIITTMVLPYSLKKKTKISSELQFLHHRHILLLHLQRFRPQLKILSFFHTKELQLRSLVSCVSNWCRDLVSVHIIYEYE